MISAVIHRFRMNKVNQVFTIYKTEIHKDMQICTPHTYIVCPGVQDKAKNASSMHANNKSEIQTTTTIKGRLLPLLYGQAEELNCHFHQRNI